MPTPKNAPTGDNADLHLDRALREDAVALAISAAKAQDVNIDERCQKLFQRYIDGDLSDVQLVAEIKRPYLH